ncbi:hypothetical protein KP509_08G066300 [Ceratopteris richardii]|nr:hypothetical protein KP509_08G066300 [Ceratopteris richardii]
MYDPDKKTWITLEHLKSSKFSGEAISAVNCNGKLHMVSGKGVFWKVGVVYDPQTGRWTDMPRGMCNGWNGPCVAVDGNLFVLEDCTGKLKMYCQSEDNWNTVIREDMLKNMEQLTQAGPGKFCGIVRAPCSSTSHCQDVVQIVDIRDPATINVLRPPFGQIVTVQVLSRTWLS